jgi:hypothetical protein
MTLDANRDSSGIDGNASYAYCLAIQSMLKKYNIEDHIKNTKTLKVKKLLK